jgi:hypothetical protein
MLRNSQNGYFCCADDEKNDPVEQAIFILYKSHLRVHKSK